LLARAARRRVKMVVSWIATAVALLIGDRLLGGVFVGGIGAALIAAFVLGLVNAVIKPVMFVMTLPVTILTLGLFVLVIDAAMLGLVSILVPHFHIQSLGSGVALAIIVAIVHVIAVSVFGKRKQHG
jgi:putative membrane protein